MIDWECKLVGQSWRLWRAREWTIWGLRSAVLSGQGSFLFLDRNGERVAEASDISHDLYDQTLDAWLADPDAVAMAQAL